MKTDWGKLSFVLVLTLVATTPLIEGGTTFGAYTISRILALLIAVGLFMDSTNDGEIRIYNKAPAFLLLSGFFLLTVAAVRADYNFVARQWFMNYMSYAIVFVAAWKMSDKKESIESLFLAVAMAECCLAYYEYFIMAIPRPNGTFFNPNYLGGYLAMAVASALSRMIRAIEEVVSSTRYREKSVLISIAYGTLVFFLIGGLLMTGSRGAAAALLASLAAIGAYKWGFKIAPFLAVGALLLLLVPNPVINRIKSLDETDIYAYSRINIWESSIDIIGDNPVGVGLGMYRFISPQYAFPVEKAFARYGQVAEMAHNSWLDIGVEIGIGGVFLLAVYVILIMLKSWKARRNIFDPLAVAAFGSVVALFVHSFVDSVQKSPPNCFMGAIFAGFILGCNRPNHSSNLIVPPRVKMLVPPLALLALWAIVSPYLGRHFLENARHANNLGNSDQTIVWLDRAIGVSPEDANIWENVGAMEYSYYKKVGGSEHLKKALDAYATCAELNPLDSSPLLSMFGIAMSLIGKDYSDKIKNEAEKLITKAIEIEPFNPFLTVHAAKLNMQIGNFSKAESYLKKSLELEPNFAVAAYLLAELYLKIGKNREAEFYYRQSIEISNKPRPRPGSRYEAELVKIDRESAFRSIDALRGKTGGFSQ